eukprot:CAMPEP_0172734088 /NCGR_PEP_ID=MMETSP1074-20121228/109012_1 /TAXON_ID=2916 /ORGANISM="Ceratium fusus, Strain PA161109" /LENGTH=49 /DNA_ID=CAMNT_0013562785 /DNA_START=241 /DNA_END=390 /DNA_ORIENTATION=-
MSPVLGVACSAIFWEAANETAAVAKACAFATVICPSSMHCHTMPGPKGT